MGPRSRRVGLPKTTAKARLDWEKVLIFDRSQPKPGIYRTGSFNGSIGTETNPGTASRQANQKIYVLHRENETTATASGPTTPVYSTQLHQVHRLNHQHLLHPAPYLRPLRPEYLSRHTSSTSAPAVTSTGI